MFRPVNEPGAKKIEYCGERDQPQKAPIPAPVKKIARDEQQPVLGPERKEQIQSVDDKEEEEELKGVE